MEKSEQSAEQSWFNFRRDRRETRKLFARTKLWSVPRHAVRISKCIKIVDRTAKQKSCCSRPPDSDTVFNWPERRSTLLCIAAARPFFLFLLRLFVRRVASLNEKFSPPGENCPFAGNRFYTLPISSNNRTNNRIRKNILRRETGKTENVG